MCDIMSVRHCACCSDIMSDFSYHFATVLHCLPHSLRGTLTSIAIVLCRCCRCCWRCCRCCCCFSACCYCHKEGNQPSFAARKFAPSATASFFPYIFVPVCLVCTASALPLRHPHPVHLSVLLWCRATWANTKWQTTYECVCVCAQRRHTHTRSFRRQRVIQFCHDSSCLR